MEKGEEEMLAKFEVLLTLFVGTENRYINDFKRVFQRTAKHLLYFLYTQIKRSTSLHKNLSNYSLNEYIALLTSELLKGNR